MKIFVTGATGFIGSATVRELIEKGQLGEAATYDKVTRSYKAAIEKGLLKIMSKMGISVIDSYRGAQIFEAIGISSELIEKCFTGTPSKIEGIDQAVLVRSEVAS